MGYKISGTLSAAARIIIIKESDWSIESNTNESGSYDVTGLDSGLKLVIARKTADGEALAKGNITAAIYSGDIGVFAGDDNGDTNVIDYITITSLGNATDFGDLVVLRKYPASTSNSTNNRGVIAGGTLLNSIYYITITSPGNTTDFGDLTKVRVIAAGVSNGTADRGVFCGDETAPGNTIDYITISSLGNATNFGEASLEAYGQAVASNGTNDRGVFAGGEDDTLGEVNIIEYITISSTGNSSDFGDLTQARLLFTGTSNGTNNRGIFAGGDSYNTIDYITISSIGNATDFGDLIAEIPGAAAVSNATNNRAVIAGGERDGNLSNIMDYITITSLGNATDFGDLTVARAYLTGTSNG